MDRIAIRSKRSALSIAKPRCNLHGALADVQPKTLLALSICKRPVRSRTKLIVPVPGLRKDVAHGLPLKIGRHIPSLQNVTEHAPVSHLGVLQTQGMAGQARRTQQLAQPLSVP
jgi:hypothetical protein